jgi:hypothetical protein
MPSRTLETVVGLATTGVLPEESVDDDLKEALSYLGIPFTTLRVTRVTAATLIEPPPSYKTLFNESEVVKADSPSSELNSWQMVKAELSDSDYEPPDDHKQEQDDDDEEEDDDSDDQEDEDYDEDYSDSSRDYTRRVCNNNKC